MLITLEAGEDRTLSQVGYGFYFNDGSGPIQVSLKEENGSVIEEQKLMPDQGLTRGPIRFEKVTIKNTHTETQNIVFNVGTFTFEDNRGGADVSVSPNAAANGLPRVTLGAGAGQVAANAARRKIYLSAPDTNAQAIWIGATVANNGLPLEPGDVLLLEVKGAVDYIGTAGDKLDLLEVV